MRGRVGPDALINAAQASVVGTRGRGRACAPRQHDGGALGSIQKTLQTTLLVHDPLDVRADSAPELRGPRPQLPLTETGASSPMLGAQAELGGVARPIGHPEGQLGRCRGQGCRLLDSLGLSAARVLVEGQAREAQAPQIQGLPERHQRALERPFVGARPEIHELAQAETRTLEPTKQAAQGEATPPIERKVRLHDVQRLEVGRVCQAAKVGARVAMVAHPDEKPAQGDRPCEPARKRGRREQRLQCRDRNVVGHSLRHIKSMDPRNRENCLAIWRPFTHLQDAKGLEFPTNSRKTRVEESATLHAHADQCSAEKPPVLLHVAHQWDHVWHLPPRPRIRKMAAPHVGDDRKRWRANLQPRNFAQAKPNRGHAAGARGFGLSSRKHQPLQTSHFLCESLFTDHLVPNAAAHR
mmetsp:Transcript_28380/g.85569  ORF Transcript_28380/g.85569 Transcript_28380/m.85569 type:complete len:411 (+) Transcript_28380:383-1615(+)